MVPNISGRLMTRRANNDNTTRNQNHERQQLPAVIPEGTDPQIYQHEAPQSIPKQTEADRDEAVQQNDR